MNFGSAWLTLGKKQTVPASGAVKPQPDFSGALFAAFGSGRDRRCVGDAVDQDDRFAGAGREELLGDDGGRSGLDVLLQELDALAESRGERGGVEEAGQHGADRQDQDRHQDQLARLVRSGMFVMMAVAVMMVGPVVRSASSVSSVRLVAGASLAAVLDRFVSGVAAELKLRGSGAPTEMCSISCSSAWASSWPWPAAAPRGSPKKVR